VDIHSNVYERNHVTAGARFKFPPLGEAINATEDQVATTQRLRSVLPPARIRFDYCFGSQNLNYPLCDFNLGSFLRGVVFFRTDKTIEVRVLRDVAVIDSVTKKSNVRELLCNL